MSLAPNRSGLEAPPIEALRRWLQEPEPADEAVSLHCLGTSYDLARAERLKSEAEGVLAEYERALADARAKAAEALRVASEAAQAEAAKRSAVLAAELAERHLVQQHLRRLRLAAGACAAFLSALAMAQDALVEAARKEGTLTFYTSQVAVAEQARARLRESVGVVELYERRLRY